MIEKYHPSGRLSPMYAAGDLSAARFNDWGYVTVFAVDLQAQNLPEENTLAPHEEDPGAFIALNPDYDPELTSMPLINGVPADGDLVPLTLGFTTAGLDGWLQPEASAGLRLWRPVGNQLEVVPPSGPGSEWWATPNDPAPQLWAEGIAVSSALADQHVKVRFHKEPVGAADVGSEDLVKFTVYALQSVEWEVYEPAEPPPGWTPNEPLTADEPYGGDTSEGLGLRIFPDAQSPDDPFASSRPYVTLAAQLSLPIPGKTVYFRWFDPDDPSSLTLAVDPNPYEGPDNLGAAGFLGAPGDGTWISAVSDHDGIARATFVVSMQPGDNYLAFGSLSEGRLAEIEQSIADWVAAGGAVAPGMRATVPLRTWRSLHVERDSFGAPDANEYFGGIGGPPQPIPQDPHFGEDDPNPGDIGGPNPVPVGQMGNWAQPSIALIQQNLAAAQILAVELPAHRDIEDNPAFVHNLVPNLANPDIASAPAESVRDVRSQQRFWVVQVFAAYEFDFNFDNDPDTELGWVGLAPNARDSDEPCLIFLETARDYWTTPPPDTNDPPRQRVALDLFIQRVTLHEVLHRFLGAHGQPFTDEGIMMERNPLYGTVPQNELTAGQINVIRGIDWPR